MKDGTWPANIDYQHATQGNVARFFWDLYDVGDAQDPFRDNVTYPADYMLHVWEQFAAGYGNRQRAETRSSGSSGNWDDPDGRNAVDYRKVECAISSSTANGFGVIGHCNALSEFNGNCLALQDSN